ncbi:hypothetical protein [Geodermatophilus marinus]|uniref:hypothetical protein n=1 Tax=Geodermatophilus sp. LHW52908 TaxID=2303986 RepID=UPI000E3C0FC4|nr:hypothetical protein [Geodermatophilus sp. LHW52908]RFU20776.1 hypothetical protein D0Z06_14630 [Geodermatophilus sp. LHW52908]
MPTYRVNDEAVARARELIDSGRVDVDTPWSDAAPSTEQANEEIARHGWDGFGSWHLAVDPDASEDTKKRYSFPYGDFSRVNRAALVHGKQRAAQNDHDEVVRAVDELLQRLDERRG